MEILLEILKFTIPAALVIVVVWYMLNKFFAAENSRQRYKLYKQIQKDILPIRFTAYERLVLFLERITPDSLVIRTQGECATVIQYHSYLLSNIRAEFEHNVAQQVYVSDEAWTMVKNAKENTVQLINACAAQVDPQAPAIELAKIILAMAEQTPSLPTTVGINYLKSELKTFFA